MAGLVVGVVDLAHFAEVIASLCGIVVSLVGPAFYTGVQTLVELVIERTVLVNRHDWLRAL